MEHIAVRGTPGHYECRQGILDKLPMLLHDGKFKKVLVIHGEKSLEAAKSYLPDLSEFKAQFSLYNGEVTDAEISRQSTLATKYEADMIVGIGGGKVLDIAKAAGDKANVDVTLIPTLASTCAACTPLSVIYNESGQFLHYTVYPRSTYLVLIEPQIILDAPIEYLRAGIGDTLAKWYEADAVIRKLDEVPVPVKMAWFSAQLCRDILLEDGEQAIKDAEESNLSHAFVRVVETNILTGGAVGGLGDQYGRIAGAHSIHNGLTQVEETHHLLHGEKVAYGILAQLALEGNFNEIQKLTPYYKRLNLPYSLTSLGIKEQDSAVKIIAGFAAQPHESIHLISQVTEEEVANSLLDLE